MKQQIQQLSFLSLQMLHETACEAQCSVTCSKWELTACLLAAHRARLHDDHGCSSTVVYAQRILGLDAHLACELLRAARALETLPQISEAFRHGQLSWSKIRELTRHATSESDKEWLDLALSRTADELQRTTSISPRRFDKAKADASTKREATEQPTLPGLSSPTSASPSAEQPSLSGATSPTPGSAPPSAEQPTPPAPTSPTPASSSAAQPHGGSSPSPAAGLPHDATSDASAGSGQGERPSPTPPTGGDDDATLPGGAPKTIAVTFHLTPDQYAEYRAVEALVRSRLQKRVRREVVLQELCRQTMASAPSRTRNRYTVLLHADPAKDRGWYDTDRGPLPASPEALKEAFRSGRLLPVGPEPERDTHADPNTKSGTNSPQQDRQPDHNTRPEGSVASATCRPRHRKAIPASVMAALQARCGGRCETCGASGVPLHVCHDPVQRGGGAPTRQLAPAVPALPCARTQGGLREAGGVEVRTAGSGETGGRAAMRNGGKLRGVRAAARWRAGDGARRRGGSAGGGVATVVAGQAVRGMFLREEDGLKWPGTGGGRRGQDAGLFRRGGVLTVVAGQTFRGMFLREEDALR